MGRGWAWEPVQGKGRVPGVLGCLGCWGTGRVGPPVLLDEEAQGLHVGEDGIGVQTEVELTLGVLPTAVPGGDRPTRMSPTGSR